MLIQDLATAVEYLSLVKPYVRDIHLLAIMFCLLLAVFADMKAAKMLFKPLNPWDIELLERYHLLLSFGLVVLWASGIYIAFEVTEGNIANISAKLYTKFTVVTILTLNAMVIGNFALPMMKIFQNHRLGDIPLGERSYMCIMSAVSTLSWLSSLSLGAVGAFKQMSAEALLFIFGHVYLIAFFGGFLMASAAGVLARFLTSRRAAMPFEPEYEAEYEAEISGFEQIAAE